MPIPVTFYELPNGRRKPMQIERPAAIEAKAQTILARGFTFELERLRTGEMSLTISDPEEGDLDIELFPNVPGQGMAAFDRIVERFALTAA